MSDNDVRTGDGVVPEHLRQVDDHQAKSGAQDASRSLRPEQRVHVPSVDQHGSLVQVDGDRCFVRLDDGRELFCGLDQVVFPEE